MSTRRILHHGPTPGGTPVLISDRAIGGCWFELHRQGGCGAGELVLQREFQERSAIEIGDWISCEGAVGQRWYLGRVEECRFQYPGHVRLRLAGMSIELNEVFPGGFDASPPERQPQRYGDTDLFSNDPDRSWEAAHAVSTIDGFVKLLLQQHVVNKTHITYLPELIESPHRPVQSLSAKFRGEESLRSVLKDLALRAQASWGVDAFGRFFFLRRRLSVQSSFRLGRDLVSLEETRDRELIFNRLLLTGDYIYDRRDNIGQIARRVFRWRANYFEPDSCQSFGNRRLRLWVPWIRTQSDSVAFARDFFRTYSQPTARYAVETVPQGSLLIPWEGPITIKDAGGTLLSTGVIEKVRVLFDHAPRFRLEVGPEDPREQWPEPPQDERWELPDHIPSNGGDISLTDFVLSSPGGGGGGGSSYGDPSGSNISSEDSSDGSSDNSSDGSDGSDGSSANPSWNRTDSLSGGDTSLSSRTADTTTNEESSSHSEASTAPSSVPSSDEFDSSSELSSLTENSTTETTTSDAPTSSEQSTTTIDDSTSRSDSGASSDSIGSLSGTTNLSESGTNPSTDSSGTNPSSTGNSSLGQTSSTIEIGNTGSSSRLPSSTDSSLFWTSSSSWLSSSWLTSTDSAASASNHSSSDSWP